jgi:hypothetical protein
VVRLNMGRAYFSRYLNFGHDSRATPIIPCPAPLPTRPPVAHRTRPTRS